MIDKLYKDMKNNTLDKLIASKRREELKEVIGEAFWECISLIDFPPCLRNREKLSPVEYLFFWAEINKMVSNYYEENLVEVIQKALKKSMWMGILRMSTSNLQF